MLKRKRREIRKWYRFDFADGAFIYLPLTFRKLKTLYQERKIHGKIIKRTLMGVRTV